MEPQGPADRQYPQGALDAIAQTEQDAPGGEGREYAPHDEGDPNGVQGNPLNPKVVAGTGASLASSVAVLVAFFMGLPPEVAFAIMIVLGTAATFAAGYMKRSQDG